jgi:hypothetical protein
VRPAYGVTLLKSRPAVYTIGFWLGGLETKFQELDQDDKRRAGLGTPYDAATARRFYAVRATRTASVAAAGNLRRARAQSAARGLRIMGW